MGSSSTGIVSSAMFGGSAGGPCGGSAGGGGLHGDGAGSAGGIHPAGNGAGIGPRCCSRARSGGTYHSWVCWMDSYERRLRGAYTILAAAIRACRRFLNHSTSSGEISWGVVGPGS